VIPVSQPFDGNEPALDAEQPLDDALRLLVSSFTEVVNADDVVRVDGVEHRPVVIVEGVPDGVVVVDRDRVTRSLARSSPFARGRFGTRTRNPACGLR
jgi:hypothetical protein